MRMGVLPDVGRCHCDELCMFLNGSRAMSQACHLVLMTDYSNRMTGYICCAVQFCKIWCSALKAVGFQRRAVWCSFAAKMPLLCPCGLRLIREVPKHQVSVKPNEGFRDKKHGWWDGGWWIFLTEKLCIVLFRIYFFLSRQCAHHYKGRALLSALPSLWILGGF